MTTLSTLFSYPQSLAGALIRIVAGGLCPKFGISAPPAAPVGAGICSHDEPQIRPVRSGGERVASVIGRLVNGDLIAGQTGGIGFLCYFGLFEYRKTPTGRTSPRKGSLMESRTVADWMLRD